MTAPDAGDSPAASERIEHDEPASGSELRPENIRALRLGHGANCSSVGSVIDTLFLGAAAGGAIFAAVCAAMRDEPIRIVGVRIARDGEAPVEGERDEEAAK